MSNLGSLFLATMDLGLSVALICVLFIVGIAVGGLFGWLIYKKSTDKKLGTVEERTKKMVDDAAAECKALKKEAILEAKEQESKLRSDFEKESREKRNELNKFEQSEYKGAQVFYSSNNEASFLLAECLQQSMRLGLDPSNERKAKESPDSVYLMKNIRSPAVTIECGFLSNPSEAELLASDRYQTKVSAAVCCGYIDYLEKSDD